MEETIDWLLSGPAYVEYLTRTDLLEQTDKEPEVVAARERMLGDPMVQDLIMELREWPGYPIKRHNDAKHPIHKLAFISDIGLNRNDSYIEEIAGKVMEGASEEGPIGLSWHLYKRWMGRDGIEMMWAMCDAPLIHYSLTNLGYGNDIRVRKGTEFMFERVMENGWRCGASDKLKGFKGPGPRESLCPYATLLMMRLLSLDENSRNSRMASRGGEALLHRWELKGTEKPFLFGIGTDFRKLKAPMIWYDILQMTDVLTRFERIRRDDRLIEMVDIVRKQANNGKYVPMSIWMAWKGWDFGQKKEPSHYMTFLVQRILRRME